MTALDLKVQDKWPDGICGDFIPEYKKSGYAAFFVALHYQWLKNKRLGPVNYAPLIRPTSTDQKFLEVGFSNSNPSTPAQADLC